MLITRKKLNLTHGYNTRGKSEVIRNLHRLKLLYKKFSYMGNNFIAKLPKSIKNEFYIKDLKNVFKQIIVGLRLYSIEKYYK